MSHLPERAVSVALHDGKVLVMRRHRDGRGYHVLPGGGVESGERPEDAALRELAEETGLSGVIQRHLWTVEHPDRLAHYFLVGVEPRAMAVGGPEAASQSENNRYTPDWVALHLLDAENLQPESMRPPVRQVRQKSL